MATLTMATGPTDIAPRIDATVTAVARERYQERGWVHLPGVVDRATAEALWRRLDQEQAPPGRDGGGAVRGDPRVLDMLEIFSGMRFRHADYAAMATSAELASVAAQLMGPWAARGIQLLEDRAIIKKVSPTARETLWHQDFNTFPVERGGAVTLWVALQDVTADMGALWFLDGSHRLGPVGLIDIFADEPYAHRPDLLPAMAEAKQHPVEMAVGDVLAFDCLTLHGAARNSSPRVRKALSIAYIPASSRYTGRNFAGAVPDGLEVGDGFPPEYFLPFPAPEEG